MSEPVEYRMRLQLRRRDLDVLGHLSNAAYHDLLDEARWSLLAALLGGEIKRDSFVLARVDIDYHAEVLREHGDVEIRTRLTGAGTSSISIEHEVVRGDGVRAASGTSILVAWDPATRGKRPLADAELAAVRP